MVELLLCKQVVVGSSPVGSTISSAGRLAGLRSLATDREGGPRPPSWAGIRAASRQVENVPRAFVRGGQTHFSLKKLCAAARAAAHRRFFVKQEAP